VVDKCSACGNPYNEATGHRWSDNIRLCGPCAVDWKDWFKGNEKRKNKLVDGKRVKFYEYAVTSIKPKE
jgi:hypothetical protein